MEAETCAGDVTLHLTDFKCVDVQAPEGAVHTTVPNSVASRIEVETRDLNIDDSLIFDVHSRDAKSTIVKGMLWRFS